MPFQLNFNYYCSTLLVKIIQIDLQMNKKIIQQIKWLIINLLKKKKNESEKIRD